MNKIQNSGFIHSSQKHPIILAILFFLQGAAGASE
jgi:hypothetical protein